MNDPYSAATSGHRESGVPATARPSPRRMARSAGDRQVLTTALLAVTLLLLLLVPRLSDLDALVTPDEVLWVARSANFYQALASGNLRDTYQFVHPGVPVMWLGALAFLVTRPDLPARTGGQVGPYGPELREILTADGSRMIDVLVDLRIAVTMFSALVVLALFFCLIPLVGRWPAAAAVAFVALDPMHIGFTRLLHLDGLSANLLLLSVTAFCVYLQRSSRVFLVVSGIAAGVAVLTRSANGVLAPIVVILAGMDAAFGWWQAWAMPWPMIRKHSLALLVWGAAAFVSCLVFWPALWVAPVQTVSAMWSGGLDLASDPHTKQILFLGQVTVDDPGWLYYPVVLAYRISPVAAIGLVLAAAAMVRPHFFGADLNRRFCFDLALFAAAYIAILSLAAKKLDRYLLPSLLALDLIAVFGWIALGRWLAGRLSAERQGAARATTAFVVGTALILQALLAAASRPYYIDEATPLLGGSAGASASFSFGWGEGGKEVAAALMVLPEITESMVLAGPWPQSIDFYLPFTLTRPRYALSPEGAAQWLEADYVVVTAPEIQRQLYPPALLSWFDEQEPIAIVNDRGRVYARILDVRGRELPTPFLTTTGSLVVNLGADTQLVAWDLPAAVRDKDKTRMLLYFQRTGAAAKLEIDAEIRSLVGNVVGTSSANQSTKGNEGKPIRTLVVVPLSADLEPGTYIVTVTISDEATGEPVLASNARTGLPMTQPLTLGTFRFVNGPDAPEELLE